MTFYSELIGSKNDNIHVIPSEIQEFPSPNDRNIHQVPQNLPQAFCIGDVRP